MDSEIEYEKKWIDGLNRGDISVADEVFDKDCDFYLDGSQNPLNFVAFKDKVKKDLDDFAGMQLIITDQIISGDRNVFRWISEGLCKENLIQREGIILDEVKDGKVVVRWENSRQKEVMKQPDHMQPDKCCTIVPHFGVLSGKLDEFKGLCKELVIRTGKEPGCLYYGFSFDEHNEYNAHCREGYANAEGLLYHINNVEDLLKKIEEVAVIYRLEIHGPSDELEKLETLRKKLERLNPMFFILAKGIRRSIIGGKA
ncbi:MAG: ester cyclase [Candidatus Scalindua sp.]|nr:ester cyclase [Candidatus Scalindua sp.]